MGQSTINFRVYPNTHLTLITIQIQAFRLSTGSGNRFLNLALARGDRYIWRI